MRAPYRTRARSATRLSARLSIPRTPPRAPVQSMPTTLHGAERHSAWLPVLCVGMCCAILVSMTIATQTEGGRVLSIQVGAIQASTVTDQRREREGELLGIHGTVSPPPLCINSTANGGPGPDCHRIRDPQRRGFCLPCARDLEDEQKRFIIRRWRESCGLPVCPYEGCPRRPFRRGRCGFHYRLSERAPRTPDLGPAEQWTVMVPDELAERVRPAAVSAGVTLPEWVRRAMVAALSEPTTATATARPESPSSP